MPRSTLACPPAKNFTDQLKSTSQSQARLSSQLRETEEDKNKFNPDEDKAFGSKGAKGSNFASSGTNFRDSSKDQKGLQASTKNLASNFNTNPTQKKCIY